MASLNDLRRLRERHPAWRLLRAGNAPLVLSFLGRVFVDDNVRSIGATALTSLLDDELYAINDSEPEPLYPKSAREYLDDWSSTESGWLRKYYPIGEDEPHFDAMPALEQAITFVASLAERSFVGTESRLSTIVDLLRQVAFGTQTDPQARLTELMRRRAEIDAEIARVEAGEFDLLDDTAVRERYQQASDTARQLLADFRTVEENFRTLDRSMREQIAGWQGSKGELLDSVLGDRSAISDSDQGRSFQAFHDFLLNSARQDELDDLLEQVHALGAVVADSRMRRVHHDWLDAAETTQATVRQLSDQLRRFLDDQAWLENRRVMDVLRSIEQQALQLRALDDRRGVETEVEAMTPTINAPFERVLYQPKGEAGVDSSIAAEQAEVDASVLYDQQYLDTERLIAHLELSLTGRSQVSLKEVLTTQPLEQGLAELVGYLATDLSGVEQVVDPDALDTVSWHDDFGTREATLPRVVYARSTEQHDQPAPAHDRRDR